MTLQTTLLSCIEMNPTIPATGSIIWLHGLGADGSDFSPIVPELNLWPQRPVRFIFPNAPSRPITINNGYVMPGWYDITSLSKIHGHLDNAGIEESVNAIRLLIEHEEQRGIPSNKIVLGGFSQGALIALMTGLRFEKPLGGIFALSGYFPFTPEELTQLASSANTNTPIFIGHGKEDTIVPYFLGEKTFELLKNKGYPVSFKSYAMAHSVNMPELNDIAGWLKTIF
ncbi:MAG: dienelactone hydrolase family protein [Gammaproteobacteria bacterium]|nr:dienelactone hydrolase family protein [Gammaproteobacteria bacterium]